MSNPTPTPTPSLDFVCVGPQRTASSWLHRHLEPHPQLSFPQDVKETMFFDQYFDKGWPWYWSHFSSADSGVKRGEIAPTYFDSPEALERLRQFEDLRIIINLRNPIERAYSAYRHYRSRGLTQADFFEASRNLPRIESGSQYATYCPQWEAAFGANHCLYLVQEQFEADPQGVVDRICDFLDVPRRVLPGSANERFGAATTPRSAMIAKAASISARALRARRMHRPIQWAKRLGLRRIIFGDVGGEEPIPPGVWHHLSQSHEPDICYLEQKLGQSFEHWRQSPSKT